ncbi:unnamed protein product [Orchesella dallaii]|uniref:Uncharacterized protein n=1 Tax=Orchesella dallaii TaxID=48710 RepID=A0ABP1R4A0_9HEXA
MSDEENSTASSQEDEPEVPMFSCRQCKDDKLYTAAQKDEHRLFHRNEAAKKGNSRRSRGRESQVGSVFTAVSSPTRKRREEKGKRKPPPKKKRRANKNYDKK